MRTFLFALLVACAMCAKVPKSSPRPEETEKGKNVVYYNQADGRWGSKMWSATNNPKQTYQSSACGPSSMAMAVATLADPMVTPLTLGEYALKNKLRTVDNGPKPEFFKKVADKYHLGYERTTDIAAGLDKIAQDKDGINVLAIALMKKGFWTKGGHYILVYDIDEKGNPWAHDPGARRRHTQNRDQFIAECRHLTLISKPKAKDEAPAKTEEVDSSLNKIKEADKTEEAPIE